MHGRKIFGEWAICWSCLLVLAMLAGVVGTLGCRGESEEPTAADGGPATSVGTPAKQMSLEHPVVRIETSLGAITVELDAVNAPGTVRNFLNYISDGYYSGTVFHYAAANRMIVGGGYTAELQPKPARTPIRSEAHNGLKNLRGTVAMARNADHVDSATTQFFINLVDAPKLNHTGDSANDYGYCVFGKVTEGLEVADHISELPTKDHGGDLVQVPDPPVVIQSIRVVE